MRSLSRGYRLASSLLHFELHFVGASQLQVPLVITGSKCWVLTNRGHLGGSMHADLVYRFAMRRVVRNFYLKLP
jgi:hypothetical protein